MKRLVYINIQLTLMSDARDAIIERFKSQKKLLAELK